MPKLSKKTLLIIAAGVFIIVAGGLFMVRSQRASEQSELKEKLALAQTRLSGIHLQQLTSRQAELEGQLTQATSQFETVNATLSQPADSVTITNTIFDIAQSYGLEVTTMTSSSPTTETLEGATCSAISFTAVVEGDVGKLVGFITKLNSYQTTGFVKSIRISVPETTSEERPSANIELVAYTFQSE